MVKLLFVCTGNICRSSTAHGILRHRLAAAGLADQVAVASAGTHGYHRGEPPDPRAIATARRFGVDISDLRAQRVSASDLDRFDRIVVMAEEHRRALLGLRPGAPAARIDRLLDVAGLAQDVPDPYYDDDSFLPVYRLIDQGIEALLTRLRQDLGQDLAQDPASAVSGSSGS
jgi:protein-tyrosine phosphatase